MLDIQSPWLIALAFALALAASACFAYFARTLAEAEAGHRQGQALLDGSLAAIGWSAAALLAGLAFSTPATIAGNRDLAAFLILPTIVCSVLALRLSAASPSLLHTLGAAGLLVASALLPPFAGALADASGQAGVGLPAGMALAALLALSCMLPALALLARRPVASWRAGAASPLLAVGWLLPQLMALSHGPTAPSPLGIAGLAMLTALNTLAVIGLFLFGRRLIVRAPSADLAQLTALRAANAALVSRLQAHDPTGPATASQDEGRCERLLQIANLAAFEWDLPSRAISYSGAWANLLGYDAQPGEWLRGAGDPLLALCHPGEVGRLKSLLHELVSGERERGHCELRLRSADGAWQWVAVNAQVVARQPNGSPRRVLGTQLDINRIKRVEHLLVAERSLFASGPVIVLTFDAEPPHRLHQASSNLQEALGQPELRLAAGQSLDALVHGDDAPRLAESVLRAVGRPGAQAQCEVRLGKADGSWPWYLLHVVAERQNAGKLLRAYLVDINGLKEAESHAADHNMALQQVVHKMGETQHFMESLQQLTELLQLCESEAESEQIIVQGGPQLFRRWSGALTFADSGGLMTVAANWGESFTAPHAMEADCWAVRRGRLHQSSVEPDVHVLSPVCSHFGDGTVLPPGIKHTICAPLLKSFDRPGVLHLVAHETMSDEELQAAAWGAETFADALKLSLGNLRLRTSLREQAVHDEMTDLYNRRYFDEALNRELSRSQRTGEGLILAMLDIDHFKNFNDSFGHEAGDEVLKKVAEHLRHFVRAYDIACRVGGEELAILMPRVHIDEAYARLDHLREEIGTCVLNYNGTQLPAVTVSIGVADLDAGSPDDLLRRADSALYAAKNSGRNRVRRWTAEQDADSPDGGGRVEHAVAAGRSAATPRTAPADPSSSAGKPGTATDSRKSGNATDAPAGTRAANAERNGEHHETSKL